MKKLFFCLIAAIGCYSAQAQKGFYLSPQVGAGIGQVRNFDLGFPFIIGGGVSTSGVFCYNGSIGIGYQWNHWRIQSGIQYLTSGFQLNNLRLHLDPASPYIGQGGGDSWKFMYNHLAIPLQIGYAISSKKFSLVPYLGILTSYNMGAKTQMIMDDKEIKKTLTKEEFEYGHNRISVWGTGALYLEYRASEKISIFGGPSVKFMLGNFGKDDPLISYDNDRELRNQTVTIDVGVKLNLFSHKPVAVPHAENAESEETEQAEESGQK